MRQKWLASVQECQRLHAALDEARNENATLDRKLRHARRNLEEETRKRRAVEERKNFLVSVTFWHRHCIITNFISFIDMFHAICITPR